MSAGVAYQPISLGSTCEAKFQLCRKLYSDFYQRKSEAGFRVQMMPPERGRNTYGWNALDWQRTPFPALLGWLENDFQHAFEREDLRIDGDFVPNSRWGTEHSHQFDSFGDTWTEATLDNAYPAIRRRFDRRVEEFREILASPGPYLYVWTASYYVDTDWLPSADQVRRLLELLSARSKDHRFHLLMVGNEGKDADYSEFGGKVTKAFRVQESGKAPAMAWEGDDQHWAQILAPFELVMHDRSPPPAKVAPAEPEPPPERPRGLFSRLLAR